MLRALLIALLLAGCATYSDFQTEGLICFRQADGMQAPLREEVMVYLPAVMVHLVGNLDDSPCKRKYPGRDFVGCCNGSDIWVYTTEDDGRLYPNQAVLGHEVQHLMNHLNDRVVNPDDRGK